MRPSHSAFAMLLSLFVQIAAASPASAQGDPLLERAESLKALFCDDPQNVEDLLDPSFLAAVPKPRLTALLKQLFAAHGKCLSSRLVERKDRFTGEFDLEFEKGVTMLSTVSVAAAPPHRVAGWLLGAAAPKVADFAELAEAMRKLGGKASFAAAKLTDAGPETIGGLEPDLPLAIGSTFKLYVLGAVCSAIERGDLSWDSVVALAEEWRSIPSGQLQDWPAGAKLTVHSLACLMISVSDNTATDHLLHTVGRKRVEEACAAMGNSNPAMNAPFLSTLDLFRLKCDSSGLRAAAYLGMTPEQKRAWLDGSSRLVERSNLEIQVFTKPVLIDRLEWFASCSDLVKAMDWLRRASGRHGLSEVQGVLSINKGIKVPGFRYIGFKGGSEPGVLNGTFLLETAGGKWFAISGSWNDTEKAVDLQKYFGLMQRAAALVEKADRGSTGEGGK